MPRLLGCALVALLVALLVVPAAEAGSSSARSAQAWERVAGTPAPARRGARPAVRPARFSALRLDRAALASVLARAPRERTAAAPLVVSLPAPGGASRRFALQRTSIMQPRLAAAHPEVRTYSGRGIDDPRATIHVDLSPTGFHASVRGPGGTWYIDPYYRRDQSLYASYHGRDLATDPHGAFLEREPVAGEPSGSLLAAADGPAVSLRTYRLALISDPTYAAYHGSANVLAAKVTLMNRVNQVYEDDFAIRMVLIDATDALNLDTTAKMTEPDGPCGTAACYTTAQSQACASSTLSRTTIVLGQLAGARSFDIGHIALGTNGGGIAGLGVVGGTRKAEGCTGVSTPVGDLYAVDYVAHEMGHQFSGNHTFDGTQGSCGANGSVTSVEPGSGSSIMAYAGICDTDDLQPHSDPYFSQRSLDEVGAYVTSTPAALAEIQTASLRDFATNGDSFTLTYEGASSAPIVRGTSYSAAGIKAAIEAIPTWPAGRTVTVNGFAGSGSPGDDGFRVTVSGTAPTSMLSLTSPSGMSGYVGETRHGGPATNGGTATATGNRAPTVELPATAYTIPMRTPFALTGAGSDADGDPLSYLWEQNDAGVGTALTENNKVAGPLFRQFGTRADVGGADTLLSPSPGENAATSDPTRVFPDMAQVLAGNTNAATGSCPAVASSATTVPPATVDCYSEFLPTIAYLNGGLRQMHFRLTARDGHPGGGGTGKAETTLTVAPAAGPFRVTSQAAPATVDGGTPLTVAWDVAQTNLAPVSAAAVRVSLSTDGGATFAHVLAASTANDGSEAVTLPGVSTTQARIKVEAVGNVFFAVNDASFTIVNPAPVVDDDAPGGERSVQYSDALPAVTVTAVDSDTAGSSLSASASGLPEGITLTQTATGAASRTWTVAGTTTAAPGAHPVTVTVDDGAGHSGQTSFTIVVTPEDAVATYSGDSRVTEGAPARLAATVAGAADGTPGDTAGATVTFSKGATTLCAGVAVSGGSAACDARLPAGTHAISMTVGGRYTGAGSADVTVAAAKKDPAAQPPPLAAATLRPDLALVRKRLKASRTRRVALKLRCAPSGLVDVPMRCTGRVTLTAKIKGVRRTIGKARFDIGAATGGTVKVELSKRAHRALRRKGLKVRLAVAVANPGAATAKASKAFALRRIR